MFNNEKVLIEKKDGYNIWGEVNSKTKRIFNFSITGVGVNSKNNYTYLSEAQRVVKHLTEDKEKPKSNKK